MKFRKLFWSSEKPALNAREASVAIAPGNALPITEQGQSPEKANQNGFGGVATQQTLEYLRQVELDDVLELMYPRLIIEQQTRLADCNRELEDIDEELAKLYASRDDVQGVMDLNQDNYQPGTQ